MIPPILIFWTGFVLNFFFYKYVGFHDETINGFQKEFICATAFWSTYLPSLMARCESFSHSDPPVANNHYKIFLDCKRKKYCKILRQKTTTIFFNEHMHSVAQLSLSSPAPIGAYIDKPCEQLWRWLIFRLNSKKQHANVWDRDNWGYTLRQPYKYIQIIKSSFFALNFLLARQLRTRFWIYCFHQTLAPSWNFIPCSHFYQFNR